MPLAPAARVGDLHVCPMVDPGPKPHVGGPVLPPGQPNVFIEGKPAARLGDLLQCVGPVDSFVQGSPTVFIGGKPASRITDALAHGGKIALGAIKTFIGDGPADPDAERVCLKKAAKSGSAIVTGP
ncbi:MAG: PAAR domain-containing protein [Verrucomicrobiales bacterium]|nr:PAAR domain-containing protein [Verrucomicrobiales bacterium]